MSRNLTVILSIFLFSFTLSAQHISDFVSLAPGSNDTDFHLPVECTFQYIIEHGDVLYDGNIIPDRFDFTGYVPINGSSTNGHLAINSEDWVGGVSVLDIHFDEVANKWLIDDSAAVDFSAVTGTSKNCSGTVTSWGTIVSCEENTSNDSDDNGYKDFGWAIEIDPVTRTVIDQPGGLNGPDKLWALGNFKHENIVIHPNLRTVYMGADSDPGYVYKFVADTPADLSSGDLYVYKGSKNGGGNWLQLDNDTPSEQNSTLYWSDQFGATVFNGVEDLEISPIDGKVYVAVKNEDQTYRFDDPNVLTGDTVMNFETYVGNMVYTVNHANGSDDVNWGNGNDNMAFDDLGNLWILQDGDDNYIWLVKQGHTQANPDVHIFGRSPTASEPTGITFSPDFRFLFMSFQHPSGQNSLTTQSDAFNIQRSFNEDVAIVISRWEFLGTCHPSLEVDQNPIFPNTYQASDEVSSAGKVAANSNTIFRADNCITLKNGFEVDAGGELLIEISSCSSNNQ